MLQIFVVCCVLCILYSIHVQCYCNVYINEISAHVKNTCFVRGLQGVIFFTQLLANGRHSTIVILFLVKIKSRAIG